MNPEGMFVALEYSYTDVQQLHIILPELKRDLILITAALVLSAQKDGKTLLDLDSKQINGCKSSADTLQQYIKIVQDSKHPLEEVILAFTQRSEYNLHNVAQIMMRRRTEAEISKGLQETANLENSRRMGRVQCESDMIEPEQEMTDCEWDTECLWHE